MHVGAVQAGERVVIIDDLIATGGTMGAGISLIGRHKGSAFLLTLHRCYQFRKQCLWVGRTLAYDHSYCASTSLM